MKSIWLTNLPTPPSVNASLVPQAVMKVSKKTGKRFMGGRMRPSPEMVGFKHEVAIYGKLHRRALELVSQTLLKAVEQGWVLRVDVYVAFHEDRVFSNPNRKILRIDANNRVKAVLDAVTTLLGIDDCFFFRGDCEKVTTAQKDSECTMVRIQATRPRTLDQVKAQMRQELQTDATPT